MLLAGERARARLREALAPELAQVRPDLRDLVDELRAVASRVSLLLPAVHARCGRAVERGAPLLQSAETAQASLESAAPDAAERLAVARTRLGELLADVSRARGAALESVARQQSTGDDRDRARRSLDKALASAQRAANALSDGRLQDARRERQRATRQLNRAGRAVKRRLDHLSTETGRSGELGSGLLDEEAARAGLAWRVEERGERFRADESVVERYDDLPYPARYRERVERYLEAIRR